MFKYTNGDVKLKKEEVGRVPLRHHRASEQDPLLFVLDYPNRSDATCEHLSYEERIASCGKVSSTYQCKLLKRSTFPPDCKKCPQRPEGYG
jgi:hypothetical protein